MSLPPLARGFGDVGDGRPQRKPANTGTEQHIYVRRAEHNTRKPCTIFLGPLAVLRSYAKSDPELSSFLERVMPESSQVAVSHDPLIKSIEYTVSFPLSQSDLYSYNSILVNHGLAKPFSDVLREKMEPEWNRTTHADTVYDMQEWVNACVATSQLGYPRDLARPAAGPYRVGDNPGSVLRR